MAGAYLQDLRDRVIDAVEQEGGTSPPCRGAAAVRGRAQGGGGH